MQGTSLMIGLEEEFAAACTLETAGDHELAAATYSKVLTAEGIVDDLRAHAALRLALIQLQQGNADRGTELLDFAASTGEDRAVRSHALWHLASALIDHFPERAPTVAPLLASYSGEELCRKLTRLKAVECLAQREAGSVGAADVLDVLEDLGTQLVAEASLSEGLNDNVAGAWVKAAFTLEMKGHLEAARVFYEALIETGSASLPVQSNALLRTGIVLDALGFWHLAPDFYHRSFYLPQAPVEIRREAAIRLAKALYSNEEYREAALVYDWLRDDPDLEPRHRSTSRLQYSVSLFRAGQLQEALPELKACTDESFTNFELALDAERHLAELYETMGHADEAKACYRRIIDHCSSDPVMKVAALTRLQALDRRSR